MPKSNDGDRLKAAHADLDAIFFLASQRLAPGEAPSAQFLDELQRGAKRVAIELWDADCEAARKTVESRQRFFKLKLETARLSFTMKQKQEATANMAKAMREAKLKLLAGASNGESTNMASALEAALERADAMEKEMADIKERLNRIYRSDAEKQEAIARGEVKTEEQLLAEIDALKAEMGVVKKQLLKVAGERTAAIDEKESVMAELTQTQRELRQARAATSRVEEEKAEAEAAAAEEHQKLTNRLMRLTISMGQVDKKHAAALRRADADKVAAVKEVGEQLVAARETEGECKELNAHLESELREAQRQLDRAIRAAGGKLNQASEREESLVKAALASLHQLRSHLTRALSGLRAITPTDGTEALAYSTAKHRWGHVSQEGGVPQFGKLVVRVEETPVQIVRAPVDPASNSRSHHQRLADVTSTSVLPGSMAPDDDGMMDGTAPAVVDGAGEGAPGEGAASLHFTSAPLGPPDSPPIWRPVGNADRRAPPGVGPHASRTSMAASAALRNVRSDPALPAARGSPPLFGTSGKLRAGRLRVVEPMPILPPLPESNAVLRGSKVERSPSPRGRSSKHDLAKVGH